MWKSATERDPLFGVCVSAINIGFEWFNGKIVCLMFGELGWNGYIAYMKNRGKHIYSLNQIIMKTEQIGNHMDKRGCGYLYVGGNAKNDHSQTL